jgi:Xaa-Pro aminopeptidase
LSRYQERRDNLLKWVERNGFDLFIVTAGANLRYLTGFTGEGIAVVSAEETVVVSDRRYEVEAAHELPDCEVRFAEEGYLREVAAYLRQLSKCRAAFEGQHVTYASHQKLAELADSAVLTPTEGVVEKSRATKDAGEIAAIRQAACVIDAAAQATFAQLSTNISERELALTLRGEIIRAGGANVSFEPVVAFGDNSARAHATPGNRRLGKGDIVLIDAGAKVDGYCSDLTRTLVFGEPDDEFIEIYQLVRRAQETALAALGPGVPAAAVDAQGREVIEASKYRGKFGHSLGHGVGLEVHEAPRIGRHSEDILAPGNVVTDEPGIYLPDWGGVRLEELVLITEQGAEPLTQTPYLAL